MKVIVAALLVVLWLLPAAVLMAMKPWWWQALGVLWFLAPGLYDAWTSPFGLRNRR